MNTMMQMDMSRPQAKLPLEYMLDYASGAAPEPVALAIATVLTMSPADAKIYHELNDVGGALLEAQPVNMASGDDMQLAAVLAQLDDAPQQLKIDLLPRSDSTVPRPLQLYVGDSYETVRWHQVTQGVEEFVLNTGTRGYRTALLRIAPGKAMPLHRHGGLEMTVVLEGAYDDVNGRFAKGDVEIAGVHDEHQPIADASTGCLCLAVLSAPLRLSGFIGWFVNPFLRV